MDHINQLTHSALNDIDDCNETENLESVREKRLQQCFQAKTKLARKGPERYSNKIKANKN